MTSVSALLESTSAHGFAPLIHSNYVWRVIWISALLISWVIMTIQVSRLCVEFSQHVSTTTVTEKKDDFSTSFPVITMCNQYPLKKDKVDENAELKAAIKKIADSLPEYISYHNLKELHIVNDYIMRKLSDLYYKMNDDARSAFYSLDDMVVSCYAWNLCDGINNITWQHPFYGQCFSLVTRPNAFVSEGSAYGMKLLVTLRNDQNLDWLPLAQGLILLIHSLDKVPFPADYGTLIHPGAVADVAATKKRTKRLSKPYSTRPCSLFNNQTNEQFRLFKSVAMRLGNSSWGSSAYDAFSCEAACLVMTAVEQNNCVMAEFVTRDLIDELWPFNNTTTCINIEKMFHWEEAIKACYELCPTACDETSFNQRITVTEFPAEDYVRGRLLYGLIYAKHFENQTVPALLKQVGLVWPDWAVDLFNEWKVQFGDSSDFAPPERLVAEATKSVKKNYVLLNVFLQTTHYTLTEQLVKMSFFDLLSSIGGTFGLWSGMSFLTILEFGQIFSGWLLQRKSAKQKPTKARVAKY